jgi:hypothetical protein
MPDSRTLTAEARRRIGLIVDQELIGGQTPTIGLSDLPYNESEERLLTDQAFMADYLNELLAERGSTLRIWAVESFHFARTILGAYSALSLVDEADLNIAPRLLAFGRWNPAVSWQPAATGAELERRRQYHFDSIEQRRLREAAKADLVELAARVEVMVRALLAETPPTAEQARHLETILPYSDSLKKLDGWAYVCRIMGYDFPGVLLAASVICA